MQFKQSACRRLGQKSTCSSHAALLPVDCYCSRCLFSASVRGHRHHVIWAKSSPHAALLHGGLVPCWLRSRPYQEHCSKHNFCVHLQAVQP